jgi:hypothetical protein
MIDWKDKLSIAVESSNGGDDDGTGKTRIGDDG